MKVLILLMTVAAIALSCSAPAPSEVKGAYKLPASDRPNLKIYTDEYRMYCYLDKKDTTASFGLATYELRKDTLIEDEIYFALDTYFNENSETYVTRAEKTKTGYNQSDFPISEPSGEPVEYQSVGNGKPSPLDGAWIMTSGFTVNEKGDTTQVTDIRQYKVYYSGNFMFGHTMVDSLKVAHTGMGFGTFEMDGDNAARETVQTSNYPEAIGSFDLAVTFNGADEFTQTIKGEGGNVSSTETYKRLGK